MPADQIGNQAVAVKDVVVHGPKDLRVEEALESPVGPGEVAVDIGYGGFCGSDLHYWQHGRNGSFEVKGSLVLGQEVVGRMRELGKGSTDLGSDRTTPHTQEGEAQFLRKNAAGVVVGIDLTEHPELGEPVTTFRPLMLA